ncbi:MAG: lysine--tRNA ligase [Candidatus Saccharimonadales bacterium]
MTQDILSQKYWLDQAVKEITIHKPQGKLVVSSGISPSGPYHIGHFREVLTTDALYRALKDAGREVVHLHFVDDFDPLRKRYPFLPKNYEEFVGTPLYLVPDPDDCHKSYAAHYYSEFEISCKNLGIEMEVKFSHELYEEGVFTEKIEQSLASVEVIRKTIEEVAGRELPQKWAPIEILSKNNKLAESEFLELDTEKKIIRFKEPDGEVSQVNYSKGGVKLNWRIDWPARWAIFGVDIEPFGKEHATRGGSYDTGKELVREVFNSEPPYPLPYETINLAGETKKMSSSLGNVITPEDALKIIPIEVLRYFVLKSRPNKKIDFDPGLGLYRLIDEYSQVELATQSGKEHEFKRAYEIARAGTKERTISSVPFNHLVAVYQAALKDRKKVFELLKRSEYKKVAKEEKEILEKELIYIEVWLKNYAPESVKFAISKQLPQLPLTKDQKNFLADLADKISEQTEVEGEWAHNAIYEIKDKHNLKPLEAFQAIYLVVLGQKSGPKAGWFLSNLDRDWLIKRLRLKG